MKKSLSLALVVCMIFALCACGQKAAEPLEMPKAESVDVTDETEDFEPIVLEFNDAHSTEAVYHKAVCIVADTVEEKTGGKIHIEVYPSYQLGKDTIGGVQMNTIDMGIINDANAGAIVPEFANISAPFIWRDNEHVRAAIDGEVGQMLDKKMAENHLTVAGWLTGGYRNVFSTKPIDSLEAFKGIKIRVMENKVHMGMFNAVGAVATPMAYAEVFNGLQQGTIDAAENLLTNVTSEKFYEVAPYVSITNHLYAFNPLIISDDAINRIPEDMRDDFFAAFKEGCLKASKFLQDSQADARKELEEKGVTVYELPHDELVAAMDSVYSDLADTFDPEILELIRSY